PTAAGGEPGRRQCTAAERAPAAQERPPALSRLKNGGWSHALPPLAVRPEVRERGAPIARAIWPLRDIQPTIEVATARAHCRESHDCELFGSGARISVVAAALSAYTITVAADVPGVEMMSTGPLAGVRVLEFSQIVAGPVAGLALSDLGADV